MYRAYQGRSEIVLWIKNEQPQKKRGSMSTDADVPVSAKVSKSRYDDHVKKTCELDEIVEKLQAKQSSKYSPEQLRAWAHMIQLKKYDSYSSPPDKPFFKSKSTCKAEKESSSAAEKKITMRSECITQLDKWHSLFEKNAITEIKNSRQPSLRILRSVKVFLITHVHLYEVFLIH